MAPISPIVQRTSVLAVLLSVLAAVATASGQFWAKIQSLTLDVLGLGFLVAAAWVWAVPAGLAATGVALLLLAHTRSQP